VGTIDIDTDGWEYYFNRNNVVHPDFDKLEVGSEVLFLLEAAGEAGRKHHYPGKARPRLIA
jgi:hypothetical protein